MITLLIIIITTLTSLLCFKGRLDVNNLLFNAHDVWHGKQWYRLFSSGLVHGGWGHLIFNMITLLFFGRVVETYFGTLFGSATGGVLYLFFYVSAIAIASLWDLVKHKDNGRYNALGASGAISAVLFASILFEPKMGIYLYLIPIPIPGYIFAPLYLVYCWHMSKHNLDNIGHSAHFWGAVYGLLFPLLCHPALLHHALNAVGL